MEWERRRLGSLEKILLALLGFILLFTAGTVIAHRVKSRTEWKLLEAGGYVNPVPVGEYELNVAAFGREEGKHTLVMLAGLGAGDFSVTGRQMTAPLEEKDRVVFVDRAGCGLSGDTARDRALALIVEDYRAALRFAGIEGPYVLVGHAVGGAYASWWESLYPDEVEAVVLLDGTELAEGAFLSGEQHRPSPEDRALALLAKLGFGRYVLRKYYGLYPDNYTAQEQRLGDALSLRTMASLAPVSESYLLAENMAAAYGCLVKNEIPKLYLCASLGARTAEELVENNLWVNRQLEKNRSIIPPKSVSALDPRLQKLLEAMEEKRRTLLFPYVEKLGNCRIEYLPGDQMIYEQKPEECARIIRAFLDALPEKAA